MATSSVLNILSKAKIERGENPSPQIDFAAVEKQVAASRPAPSARHIAIDEDRELEQLEAAYSTIFEANGASHLALAEKHRQRQAELEAGIAAAEKRIRDNPGNHNKLIRAWERAQVELAGVIRKAEQAEAKHKFNLRCQAEFREDGRLQRLTELRKRKAQRKIDLLSVL